MATTPSTQLELGAPAPDFSLPDVISGQTVALADFAARRGLVVMFLCHHCPYVVHVQAELARLGRDYQPKGVGLVAICSNDSHAYPDDAPPELARQAREQGFSFPYLHDESQAVARTYGAVCTPDLYLFDKDRKLIYRGQLDDGRPGNDRPSDGRDLRAALDALLAGRPVSARQKPSVGCSIKWKRAS
jgi:peroxiredoxin